MSKKKSIAGIVLVNFVLIAMEVIDDYPAWPHTRHIVLRLITLLAVNAIMLHKSKENFTK